MEWAWDYLTALKKDKLRGENDEKEREKKDEEERVKKQRTKKIVSLNQNQTTKII